MKDIDNIYTICYNIYGKLSQGGSMKNKKIIVMALSLGLILANNAVSSAFASTNTHISQAKSQSDASTIEELINMIDDLDLSPNEKANLAIKLYDIKSKVSDKAEALSQAKVIFAKAVEQIKKDKGKENPFAEVSKKPSVDPVTKDSEKISGTGVPGSIIEIYYGTTKTDLSPVSTATEIKVGKDGKWSIARPGHIGLVDGFLGVSQKESGKKPNYIEMKIAKNKIAETSAEKVKNKRAFELKDINIWKNDPIDWKKGLKLAEDLADEDKKFAEEALKNAKVEDASSRSANKIERQEGSIKITFDDKSELKLAGQILNVSSSITAASAQNVPSDAVEVEIKLGEGVQVVKGQVTKIGNKDNPSLYNKYKVKPGSDIKVEKIEALQATIFDLIKPEALEGYEDISWKGEKVGFVVGNDNKVFVASAKKKAKPEEPDKGNKPETNPEQKPDADKNKKPEGNNPQNPDKDQPKKPEKEKPVPDGGKKEPDKKNPQKPDDKPKQKPNPKPEPQEKPNKNEKENKKPESSDNKTSGRKQPEIKQKDKSYDYYYFFRSNTYKQETYAIKIKSYKKLKQAYNRSLTTTRAAKLLLEIAPNKVKDIKKDLLALIKESEKLRTIAEKRLKELEIELNIKPTSN